MLDKNVQSGPALRAVALSLMALEHRMVGAPGLACPPTDQAAALFAPLLTQATTLRVGRDQEIVAQGAKAEHCFVVLEGCVRTVRLLEDGRRQVGEFLFAGDAFGWEMVGLSDFAAEAVTPAALARVPLAAIGARADADSMFAHQLCRYGAEQVRLARGRLVSLCRKTAAERIAAFLTEMQERLPSAARGGIDLPMNRSDMADYLGLTIETVCRGLTELRRMGTISVERARIVVRDRHALASAGSDRLH